MTKIGRNRPCPCGSGKKFKCCHGRLAPSGAAGPLPPEVWAGIDQKLKEVKALHARREKQQGLGRPIVSTKTDSGRIIVVGDRMHHSPRWHTFHDFLRGYLLSHLGQEWYETEQAKPAAQQHPIVRWAEQFHAAVKSVGSAEGQIYRGPMTGGIRAFLNLSYNIYLVAHHTPQQGDAIVTRYVQRLKSARPSDFTGALFETYAAAAFLKAGFTLGYENEQDSSISHVEFVATFPKSGKRFSVEVKSRERPGTAVDYGTDVDDVRRLRVARKLNRALAKAAEHMRVVLIEVNVPDIVMSIDGWPAAALKEIRDNELVDLPSGEKKPSAYVIVTNHAFHNNLDAADTGLQCLATGFHISDFGPDVPYRGYRAVLEARDRHQEMFALLESIKTHYEIPSTYQGEMPELAFPEPGSASPLVFGRWYLIPMPDGQQVPGRLYDAVVIEEKKQVFGVL
jgi:hypothetical protein